MTGFSVLMTSVARREERETIAHALVESRMAACVKAVPVASTYRWQGDVEQAGEHLLIAKIRDADFPEVAALITRLHSYEVPEIVSFPIADAAAPYLAWLAASTARSSSEEEMAK